MHFFKVVRPPLLASSRFLSTPRSSAEVASEVLKTAFPAAVLQAAVQIDASTIGVETRCPPTSPVYPSSNRCLFLAPSHGGTGCGDSGFLRRAGLRGKVMAVLGSWRS